MSITNDIRSHADTAIEQGKQVVGQAVGTAQQAVDTATQQFADAAGKAAGTVNDLRAQAEKTLNVDALRDAVEPYLAQARQYRSAVTSTVTDRAEDLYETVKDDPRVARFLSTAETMTGLVIDTVQQRIVKPVSAFTAHSATNSAPTKPAATKSATTRPAAKSTTTKPTAKKAPAKKTTAQKATAEKTTAQTATKSTAKKAPAKKTTSN